MMPHQAGPTDSATASAGIPARRAAYEVLRRVAVEGAYANLAMPEVLRAARLHGSDAALATELAFGTLRGQGLYNPIIAEAARRPMDRIEPVARDVLRLAAHQALMMRVPDHAVVDTTVRLAKSLVPRASGFINAVARRITERDRTAWIVQVAPDPAVDPTGYLSIAESHPRWIITALHQALGSAVGGRARLAELLAVNNTAAPVTLVARDPSIDMAALANRIGATAGRWSPLAIRLAGGAPSDIPEVRAGRVAVQDEGSQLVALALAAADVRNPSGQWLDMCAGPGGKAALLAGIAAKQDASLTALELHPHRADLVRKALSSVPGRHRVEVTDATTEGWTPRSYDRVLVDVPCTGLGAIRRRPEARWRRSPDDLPTLAPLQRNLLSAALRAVRPGGVVGYATCSPHLVETDLVVRDVLRKFPDHEVLDAPALLPDVPNTADGPYLRLWPHIHDTDGMFLAVIRAPA